MPNRPGQPKQQDQVSVFFADITESFEVEPSEDDMLLLVHQPCREVLCTIASGDTIRVLLNTALHHDCPD